MKKSFLLAVVVIMAMLSMTSYAEGKKAAVKATASSGGGDIGVGIMLGNVNGLNLKFWNSGSSAIDVGVAWFSGGNSLYLQGDYLLHAFTATGGSKLGAHYGIGLNLYSSRYGGAVIGLRVPLGVDFVFPKGIFDIYAEIAPTMYFSHSSNVEIEPEIGFRYYF